MTLAQELLRELEWDRIAVCPVCSHTRTAGHASDCRFAAALAQWCDPLIMPDAEQVEDWRSTVGMFEGDAAMQEIQAEARATRAEPPASAPVATDSAGDGWVSVTDRLPDDGHPVLVSTYCIFIARKWTVRGRDVWDEVGTCNSDIQGVTHWRPLPAPPATDLNAPRVVADVQREDKDL